MLTWPICNGTCTAVLLPARHTYIGGQKHLPDAAARCLHASARELVDKHLHSPRQAARRTLRRCAARRTCRSSRAAPPSTCCRRPRAHRASHPRSARGTTRSRCTLHKHVKSLTLVPHQPLGCPADIRCRPSYADRPRAPLHLSGKNSNQMLKYKHRSPCNITKPCLRCRWPGPSRRCRPGSPAG